MAIIRERRQKLFKEQEAEKQENLKRKQTIIERIKAMVTSPEEANQQYQEFKQLQQEWKEIKAVPAENNTEIWRSYQLYVEQFYDLLKLNSEAREYDFKKNLEAKTKLCEAAEKLAEEEDAISAFHQLQELHQEYREVGPVAKDLREEVWTRFKAASTVINKRHQQHFEQIRATEEENLAKKTTLCEKAEELLQRVCQTSADFESVTKEIIALQTEWKTIGFAPQKMNVKIFDRFRAACDAFFQKKTQYFKELKERFADNIAKKQALVEQAVALKDSTDWKQTADKLQALQKEWKEIGMVPKKIGDQLWQDFLGACNFFFEARNAANAGTRNTEKDNLQKKHAIIDQLEKLAEDSADNLQVASTEVLPNTVVITGLESRLEEIMDVETEVIDISNLSTDTVVDAKLYLPEGIAVQGDEQIQVRFVMQADQRHVSAEIELRNLPSGMQADLSRTSADIVVSGRSELLHDSQELNRLKLYVDASNLTAGAHVLPVQLEYSGSLNVEEFRPQSVTVTVSAGASSAGKPVLNGTEHDNDMMVEQ